jgi:hypothetical protein
LAPSFAEVALDFLRGVELKGREVIHGVAYIEGSIRIEGNDLELAAEPSHAGHLSSLHDYLAPSSLRRWAAAQKPVGLCDEGLRVVRLERNERQGIDAHTEREAELLGVADEVG